MSYPKNRVAAKRRRGLGSPHRPSYREGRITTSGPKAFAGKEEMKRLSVLILLLILAAAAFLPRPILERFLNPVRGIIEAALPISGVAKNSVLAVSNRGVLRTRASATASTSHAIFSITKTSTITNCTVTPSDTKTSASTDYTVVPGDTLSAIAKAHGVTVEEIVEVNEITNPNLLRVGQVLTIPSQP